MRGARLIAAACLLLGCQAARAQVASPSQGEAQTVPPWSDPFASKPAVNPKPFQPADPTKPAAVRQVLTFTPPASGAGHTGFDSTNTRRQQRPRRAKSRATAGVAQASEPGAPQALAVNAPQAIAPGAPQPLASPDKPDAAYAQAPGQPPVELGPIRKPLKRKRPRVEDDPYAQLGIRAGAFDIYPAVELIGGYSSNPGQEPDGKGAKLYTVAPELRLQSLWPRHELKAELRGSYTGYSPDETPTLSRPYLNGKADARIDVRRDTQVDLGARVLVSTDNPNSPNLPAGLAKLPVFATFGGGAGLTQRFNRVELTVKGDAERTAYQDSELTDGSSASNADRNYDQFGGAVRVGYETLPGVKPFVEIGADTRTHDVSVDESGYQRNSKGLTGSVGTSFALTRVITGETSIGYTRRTYDEPRFDPLAGLIGNASLIWTLDALTTVKFSAASTIGESSIPGVPGVFYRDAGVQIDHAFRRWLVGTLKLGIGQDLYKGSSTPGTPGTVCDCVQSTPGSNVADRTDNRYSVGLGLTYKIDRTMQIKGEFRQDWLRSNVEGVDYTASTFLVGLRLQR